ncbi:MAG TPA: hypothetical protein VF061_09635 [Gemmatimonadales bacterium]
MRVRCEPALAMLALVACGGHGARGAVALPPVPVEGPARDVRALAGSWRGEFVSETGLQRGVIAFDLPRGRDTAYGHVVFSGPMPPPGCTDAVSSATEPREPTETVLALARVTVGGSSVGGWLESYRDPRLGCPVDTWFEGTIQGDTLGGMYFTHPADTAATVRLGTWWAARTR